MKIRVLHIITRLVRGGADENTVYTVYGLDRSCFHVDLLYGDRSEPELMSLPNRPDISFFCIPELRREVNLWADLRALWKLFRFISKGRYHIVHTHTAKAGFIGRIAAFAARTPIIIHTLHGATFGNFLSPLMRQMYVFLERIGTFTCDKIICVGEDLKGRYLAKKIGPPSKYVVIYSGMNLDRFFEAGRYTAERRREIREKLGLLPSAIVIGNISRLEPRKGHIFFIEAAGALLKKHPEIMFLIVGDGELRGRLEQEVQCRGLAQSILFTGFRKDIEAVLSILDISTLTSLWEGLPRVLIQSAAVGKPIVTFSVEGATEVVREGKNGFIVPSMDVSAFAGKIEWLLDNPAQARQMGAEGRNIVGNAWQVETMVEKIQDLYFDLIAQEKQRRLHCHLRQPDA